MMIISHDILRRKHMLIIWNYSIEVYFNIYYDFLFTMAPFIICIPIQFCIILFRFVFQIIIGLNVYFKKLWEKKSNQVKSYNGKFFFPFFSSSLMILSTILASVMWTIRTIENVMKNEWSSFDKKIECYSIYNLRFISIWEYDIHFDVLK